MADLKISELTQLVGTDVAAGDQLPIVDSSASQTKRVSAEGLVAAGVKLIPDASIPLVKVNTTTFSVPDGSITAPKLAATSVGTAALIDGAVTDAKIGAPISASKFGTQAANVVLAGPLAGAAAAVSFRPLGASDLPVATAIDIGGVKPGSGLVVSAAGALDVSLTSALLPLATTGGVGAMKPGSGLAVSADGTLNFAQTVAAGTGTKITYTQQGLVSGSAGLDAADIPNLDAAKITSGTFGTARFEKGSVTQDKLADYAISYIQEAAPPTAVGAHPIGELWFQESSARLSMWNGNSWMAVGQGALSGQNLRFCGTFDATNGQVKALTTFGTSDGFTIGSAIPAATNNLTGCYFVCDTAGNGAGVAAGVAFDPGDWIVCLGQARGWERIDTLNGGSGGGGATLDSLTDVAVTTPATGDILVYTGSGWVNRQGNVDPGTYA